MTGTGKKTTFIIDLYSFHVEQMGFSHFHKMETSTYRQIPPEIYCVSDMSLGSSHTQASGGMTGCIGKKTNA